MTDKSHLSLEATDQARTPPLFDPLYSPSSYSLMFNYYFEVFHQSIYFAERFLVKNKTSYNYVFESYYQISSFILCIPSRTQLSSNPNPLFCFLKSLNFLFTCSLLFPINREIIYKSVPQVFMSFSRFLTYIFDHVAIYFFFPALMLAYCFKFSRKVDTKIGCS